MRNSGVTKEQVKASFKGDLVYADADYYYDLTLDWSNANGRKRIDWIAQIRNIARSDLRKGKMKQRPRAKHTIEPAGKDYGKASPTAIPMPEHLKEKFNNIGKIEW